MLARFPLLTSLPVVAALVLAPKVASAGNLALTSLTVTQGITSLQGFPCTAATAATDCASVNVGENVARCSPVTGTCVYAYESVTVMSGGTLAVAPLQAASGGNPGTTGWLSIQANTITVASGGMISADGAGYQGVAGGTGASPMGSNGGGHEGMTNGLPGGGGGYFSPGADGVTLMPCTNAPGATGGAMYFDVMTMALSLGSAGGAANSTVTNTGAAGGGGIELMAAVMVIDGTVSAAGGSAFQANGVGPGGGSGGSIRLLTANLTGGGALSVAGGDGAAGAGNNGGGGSGGVILVTLPATAMLPQGLMTSVAGGSSGACNAAGAGMLVSAPLPSGVSCVDADGDGSQSMACGGDDCDDADPNVHPGAPELCNGVDDDCDGTVDEAEDGGAPLCTAPLVCSAGMCQVVDAGVDSGPPADAGALPDHVDYGGGIGAGCGVPPGVPTEGAAALALAVGTLLLGASRRRPPRRRR